MSPPARHVERPVIELKAQTPGEDSLSLLHVVPSLDEAMGGSVQAALLICHALVAAGADVTVASSRGPQDRLDYLASEFSEVRCSTFPRRRPHHYYRSPGLHRWLRRHIEKFDVIHVHGVFNFAVAYALRTARASGKATVLHPHGQLDPYDLRKHPTFKRAYASVFLRRALEHVDRVVVTSEREAAVLETFGADVDTICLPLPVRPLRMGDGPRFRTRHGIDADALVVTSIARIDPKKRIDLLIQALPSILQAEPRTHLLLVGEGPDGYVAQMRALADASGTSDHITWTGLLRGEEKEDALAASTVFALPSENENFGITLVESLYAGVPVVISEHVYIHETLQGNGVAEVCSTTADSVAEAILRCVRDRDHYAAMSRRAPSLAGELFSTDDVGRGLLTLYRTLAVAR